MSIKFEVEFRFGEDGKLALKYLAEPDKGLWTQQVHDLMEKLHKKYDDFSKGAGFDMWLRIYRGGPFRIKFESAQVVDNDACVNGVVQQIGPA